MKAQSFAAIGGIAQGHIRKRVPELLRDLAKRSQKGDYFERDNIVIDEQINICREK